MRIDNKAETQRIWDRVGERQKADDSWEHDATTELGKHRDAIIRLEEGLGKIEVQLCSESRTLNLMHSKELTAIAPMFHKLFGEAYPTDATTYPTVGDCK